MHLTLFKRKCFFFPLFKQFLETEMTWRILESNNHCKRMHFQKSELVFRVTLKGKSIINEFNVN